MKASGGLPMKTSSARRPQHVRRPAGAGRHHVAVEVHRALGLAGGAGGEGHQAGVVGGGVDVVEASPSWRAIAASRPVGAGVVEEAQLRAARAVGGGQLQLVGQAQVAQRMADLRLVDDLLQLLGAQQRHAAHRDAAGLDHREPAGRQHRRVRRAQQHAVARHQPHVVHQHVGDAVGLCLQLGIGPAQARRLDAQPVAAPFGDMRGRAARWRSSAAPGTAASGSSNRYSGCASGGGRWSRAKVSMWAEVMVRLRR